MRIRLIKILKACVVFIFTMAFSPVIFAQEMSVLQFLPAVAQSSLANPAIQNASGKMTVGIPLLSGMAVRWGASVPLNALFSGGFEYSFDRLYNAMDKNGDVNASAEISLFFAGLRHNDYTFTLSVRERFSLEGIADREIARFIRDGTLNFYGKNETFGNATFYLTNFREIAPGFSKRIWENLDLGIRAKVLFGHFRFQTEDLNLSVATDKTEEKLLLNAEGSYFFSAPFSYSDKTENGLSGIFADAAPGDYFFKPRNLGVALDFGIIYRPDNFWELSASILDAGLIGFKHKAYEADFVRPVRFSEYELYQSDTPGGDSYREPRMALLILSDSVPAISRVENATTRMSFTLPVQAQFSAKYRFNQKISAGLNEQFTMYRLNPVNIFSAFFTAAVHPKLDLYGSLSSFNFRNMLPGAGVVYTGDRVQIYFTSSNILSIIQPFASKQLNLSFGVNFLFGTE